MKPSIFMGAIIPCYIQGRKERSSKVIQENWDFSTQIHQDIFVKIKKLTMTLKLWHKLCEFLHTFVIVITFWVKIDRRLFSRIFLTGCWQNLCLNVLIQKVEMFLKISFNSVFIPFDI